MTRFENGRQCRLEHEKSTIRSRKVAMPGARMERLFKASDTPGWFGDLVVLGFLLVQCLDGAFTYLGVSIWGLGIEANPLISSVVNAAGLGAGLAGAKLVAIGF